MAGKGGNEMRLFVRLGRFLRRPYLKVYRRLTLIRRIMRVRDGIRNWSSHIRYPKLVVTYTVSGEEFIPQIQII